MRVIVAAGVLLAVLSSGCASSSEDATVHTAGDVSDAFSQAGLPLRSQPIEGPDVDIYNPSGAPLPKAAFGSEDGLNFYVVVYATSEEAEGVVSAAPDVDPILGQERLLLRDGNVVAVVQPPDDDLVTRIDDAFAEL